MIIKTIKKIAIFMVCYVTSVAVAYETFVYLGHNNETLLDVESWNCKYRIIVNGNHITDSAGVFVIKFSINEPTLKPGNNNKVEMSNVQFFVNNGPQLQSVMEIPSTHNHTFTVYIPVSIVKQHCSTIEGKFIVPIRMLCHYRKSNLEQGDDEIFFNFIMTNITSLYVSARRIDFDAQVMTPFSNSKHLYVAYTSLLPHARCVIRSVNGFKMTSQNNTESIIYAVSAPPTTTINDSEKYFGLDEGPIATVVRLTATRDTNMPPPGTYKDTLTFTISLDN